MAYMTLKEIKQKILKEYLEVIMPIWYDNIEMDIKGTRLF